MTKLAILAGAARGHLAERAEELRPEPCGSARSTASAATPCKITANAWSEPSPAKPACPSGYRDPILPDQKIVVSIPGLSIEI